MKIYTRNECPRNLIEYVLYSKVYQTYKSLNHLVVLVLIYWLTSEAVSWRCSVKQVFLKTSQNSQENTCARVDLLMKLQS